MLERFATEARDDGFLRIPIYGFGTSNHCCEKIFIWWGGKTTTLSAVCLNTSNRLESIKHITSIFTPKWEPYFCLHWVFWWKVICKVEVVPTRRNTFNRRFSSNSEWCFNHDYFGSVQVFQDMENKTHDYTCSPLHFMRSTMNLKSLFISGRQLFCQLVIQICQG